MTGWPTNIMRLLLVCLAVSLALAAGASHKTLALAREQLPKRQSGCIWLPAYLR